MRAGICKFLFNTKFQRAKRKAPSTGAEDESTIAATKYHDQSQRPNEQNASSAKRRWAKRRNDNESFFKLNSWETILGKRATNHRNRKKLSQR